MNLIGQQTGTFKDTRDGKEYKTVVIGTQTWFAENLAYKPNGGGYWAYNDDQNQVAIYGYLYNFKTASESCPVGWHLPGVGNWVTLYNFLIWDLVGAKVKETGLTHWLSPNTGANNSSGFTALPGGWKVGKFRELGLAAYWWAKAGGDSTYGVGVSSTSTRPEFESDWDKEWGVSVRCIMD